MSVGNLQLHCPSIRKQPYVAHAPMTYPRTIDVFRNYGMGCFGCAAAQFENIEQGALAHGIDIDALVADLNKTV